MNRTLAPESKEIETIQLIKPEVQYLSNGVPVYVINAGTQELVKIEFIFPAGSAKEHKPLVANCTSNLLKEGTTKSTSAEIAEKLDFFGAFLEAECHKDNASISLYSLNKHLDKTFPLLAEVLLEPSFPVKELNLFLQNNKQKYVVSLSKVDFLARHKFNELLFGKDHPYGKLPEVTDYDNVNVEDLIQFYKEQYDLSTATVIIAGKVEEHHFELLEKLFGKVQVTEKPDQAHFPAPVSGRNKEIVEKQDAIQSALRIGKIMFNKTHPDYIPMQILNCVLGGYFGSRLMNNIREDKGYTYGIGSALVSMKYTGYFFITTEVGVDVTQKAINEIYYELKRLREDLIPKEELELVKNYLLGMFIRSADGPFALADKLKGVLEYGLTYEYFDRFIHTIKTITSEELQAMAQKYFKEEDQFELVVGKKEIMNA